MSDALLDLMRAIVRGERDRVVHELAVAPDLAVRQLGSGATRQTSTDFFFTEIAHYAYAGDTLLHIAAAAHDAELVRRLCAVAAGVGAVNRRGQEPLHYAVDGSPSRDASAQAEAVSALLDLGADVNATDKNGTTPLMRAVRNRCAAAVRVLLDAGADPGARNQRGSTALQLAVWTTGKSGSGTPEAQEQQREIVELLNRRLNAT